MYNEELKKSVKEIIIGLAVKRSKNGHDHTFKPKALTKLLRKQLDLSLTDLNLVLKELHNEKFWQGERTLEPFELQGDIVVSVPQRDLPEHEKIWLHCLSEGCDTSIDRDALLSIGPKLEGFNFDRQKKLLAGLNQLREKQDSLAGQALYDVSSRFLLGSSKLLESIKKEALMFGIKYDSFSPSYRYISVASPLNPKAVILVENPHSFETAVQADIKQEYAWLCSYGFGIALDKNYKYGELLFKNLTEHKDQLIVLTRSGEPPELKKLLSFPHLSFWGDLDTGGLSIFLKLKKTMPHLKISPLYAPMINSLEAGEYHPYTKIVGKSGQQPFESSCKEIMELMAICYDKGVDQESVSLEQISEYIKGNLL
ncbi:MAG: hypothetical protein ACI8PB_000828 [Desulforhopalus sp.]|jgi:hypothetical protein